MKSLIVEDEEEIATFIRYVLEDERHSVRVAGSVGEAWRELRDFAPDLIVIDRGLPDQDGLELCRELRRRPGTARVPIMVVSGKAEPGQIAEGLEAGADDYVTKPVDFVNLLARVTALMGRATPPASRPQ